MILKCAEQESLRSFSFSLTRSWEVLESEAIPKIVETRWWMEAKLLSHLKAHDSDTENFNKSSSEHFEQESSFTINWICRNC